MAAKEDLDLTLDAEGDNVVQFEVVPDDPGTAADELEACRRDCLASVAPFLEGYIWQRDGFSLQASTSARAPWRPASAARPLLGESAARTCYLWGSARFGDNLDDAWFISWLLRELTRQFPALSARVWDNDGEFLLIEAAYALPRWVKPETAGNRVWIRGGALHIIPLPSEAHPSIPSMPTPAQAHKLLMDRTLDSRARKSVQAVLEERWGMYPDQARKNAHHARCLVPKRVAGLLAREPGLVAAAVNGFVHRDPDDMRAAAAMAHFPPQDMVEVTVRFSRSLYAQTALQVFEPPRGFPMPPDMSPASATARLGMKLTCGFEMLYAQHARFKAPDQLHPKAEEGEYRSAGVVTTNPTTAGAFHEREQGRSAGSALNSNPAAQAYLASLQRRGYFQNSLPGSAKHTQLREAALCTFMTTEQYERSVAVLAAPAHRIDELLCEDPPQALLDQMQGREDSDAWMSSGAEELDTQLAAREEEQAQGRKGTRHPAFNPDNMVARMKAFMEAHSSYEGAEVPDTAGGIEFNDARFLRELGGVLDLDQLPDASGSDSDSDEGSFSGSDSDETASNGDGAAPGKGAAPAPAVDRLSLPGPLDGRDKLPAARMAANSLPGLRPATPDIAAQRPEPQHSPSSNVEAMQLHSPGAASKGWEVDTATDSDDEPGFSGAYDAALAEQLAGTTLAKTFPVVQEPVTSAPADDDRGAAKAGASAGSQFTVPAGESVTGGLQPVDVDLNLVQSLLASYAGQQGLAGPASNLAGLMGLHLPDNTDDASHV